MQITDQDLQKFRERAKSELQSNGDVGRLAWDVVVNALCNEVEELRKAIAPGNVAAMREALKRIADMAPSLGGFEEPVDGDSSAIYQGARCDGKKFLGKEIPAWWGAKWRQDISNAIDTARSALAAPARNCDRFKTLDEAREAFQDLRGHKILADVELWDSMDEAGALVRWLFAPAEGGEK